MLIHTTPDADKQVCEAVLKAYTEQDFKPFVKLFDELYAKRQKNEFLELFMVALGERVRPAAINGLHGYVVDNEFFVAQNGNAYKIMPSREGKDDKAVSEQLVFFCIVPRNHQIKPMNLLYNNVHIVLGQQEQIFLSKIIMLLNKEKYKNDTVFWRQVERSEDSNV
jgi:hypothetical protein